MAPGSAQSRVVIAPLPQVATGLADESWMEGGRKLIEYWRWRYRDPKTGRVCRTLFQLTEAEARKLPEAERIAGSMLLRGVETDDFPDTGSDVHPAPLNSSPPP
jgi:hypothetical protein